MKNLLSVLSVQSRAQLFKFNTSYTQVSGLATKAAESDVFSTDSNTPSALIDSEFDIATNIPDAEESIEKEEKFRKHVERMRDVSRFSKFTAENKYRKQIPTYSDKEALYLKQAKYFRNVYSKYGKSSGVEAGIAWPSKKELNELIQEEQAYGMSLKEKIDLLIERKNEEIKNIENLQKETDSALNKMPKMVEKFYQNVDTKNKLEDEKKIKKQEILDQAREHYGFEVDLRDKRIKDMVDKLQEDKKKADKAKKKEDEKKRAQAAVAALKYKEGEMLLEKEKKEASKEEITPK